jgi:(p)ppGpp synthase/HD superfamily hydrolase
MPYQLDPNSVVNENGRAGAYAAAKHDGQFRAGPGKVPYVLHPIRVGWLAAPCYRSVKRDVTYIVALLHDVVEDTDATLEEVAELFGEDVAGYVAELTKPAHLSRKEQVAWMLETAPTMSRVASNVKAADRIDNLRSFFVPGEDIGWPEWKVKRYIDEAVKLAEGLVNADRALINELYDEIVRSITKLAMRRVAA